MIGCLLELSAYLPKLYLSIYPPLTVTLKILSRAPTTKHKTHLGRRGTNKDACPVLGRLRYVAQEMSPFELFFFGAWIRIGREWR